MGMHCHLDFSKNTQHIMKLFVVLSALAIQSSLALPGARRRPAPLGRKIGGSKKDRFSWPAALEQIPSEAIGAAVNGAVSSVCNCGPSVVQWTSSLFNAGQSCLNVGGDANDKVLCTATALGLICEEGDIASVEDIKAIHGGTDDFDAAIDNCYSSAFDDCDDAVAGSIAFNVCMEYAVADMCEVPTSRSFRAGRLELVFTRKAMSRALCN